jgi:hypothetical protein
MRTISLFSTAIILIFAANPTFAAPVTKTFAFTATDFEYIFGSGPPPVDPASGTVSVSFDDSIDQTDVTTGVQFSGFNFAVDTATATPGYTYDLADDLLLIGTVCNCGFGGVDAIGPGSDAFLLGIFDPAGAHDFGFFLFSQAGSDTLAIADSGSVAAVPEPTIWILMTSGFCMIGATLRRGGRQARLQALSGRTGTAVLPLLGARA